MRLEFLGGEQIMLLIFGKSQVWEVLDRRVRYLRAIRLLRPQAD